MAFDHQHALLQFFTYDHLPPILQKISRPFHALANDLDMSLPDNGEKDGALRKLLEAKDCAVRARLYQVPAGHAEATDNRFAEAVARVMSRGTPPGGLGRAVSRDFSGRLVDSHGEPIRHDEAEPAAEA